MGGGATSRRGCASRRSDQEAGASPGSRNGWRARAGSRGRPDRGAGAGARVGVQVGARVGAQVSAHLGRRGLVPPQAAERRRARGRFGRDGWARRCACGWSGGWRLRARGRPTFGRMRDAGWPVTCFLRRPRARQRRALTGRACGRGVTWVPRRHSSRVSPTDGGDSSDRPARRFRPLAFPGASPRLRTPLARSRGAPPVRPRERPPESSGASPSARDLLSGPMEPRSPPAPRPAARGLRGDVGTTLMRRSRGPRRRARPFPGGRVCVHPEQTSSPSRDRGRRGRTGHARSARAPRRRAAVPGPRHDLRSCRRVPEVVRPRGSRPLAVGAPGRGRRVRGDAGGRGDRLARAAGVGRGRGRGSGVLVAAGRLLAAAPDRAGGRVVLVVVRFVPAGDVGSVRGGRITLRGVRARSAYGRSRRTRLARTRGR